MVFADARDEVMVRDLCGWHYIEVKCQACGHVGRVYATLLWKRYSTERLVADLARRFRCTSCGTKAGDDWNIMKFSRNA